MKYKKAFHIQKDPHFLNVLFPTILPYDWLSVIWFLLTFRTRKAILRAKGILMLMKLNKIGRNEYIADYYSLRGITQSDIMSEKYRFSALINEAEKDKKEARRTL